jgi:TusA-related sulfurtransferase
VNSLGYKVIGFGINADAGATNSVAAIQKEMAKTKSGDIIIAHMNHPESHNSEGLSKALKKMQDNGWKFVKVTVKKPIWITDNTENGFVVEKLFDNLGNFYVKVNLPDSLDYANEVGKR